jgi:hypothetical protein
LRRASVDHDGVLYFPVPMLQSMLPAALETGI